MSIYIYLYVSLVVSGWIFYQKTFLRPIPVFTTVLPMLPMLPSVSPINLMWGRSIQVFSSPLAKNMMLGPAVKFTNREVHLEFFSRFIILNKSWEGPKLSFGKWIGIFIMVRTDTAKLDWMIPEVSHVQLCKWRKMRDRSKSRRHPPERCSGNFRLSLPCGHWSLIPSCGTGRLAKTWRWHSSTTISGVWVLRDLGNTGFTDIDSFTRYHSIPFDSIRVKGTKFERPRAGHLWGYSSGFPQAAKDPIAHKPCDPGDHRDEAKIGPKHLPSKLGRPIFGMYNWVMCFFPLYCRFLQMIWNSAPLRSFHHPVSSRSPSCKHATASSPPAPSGSVSQMP